MDIKVTENKDKLIVEVKVEHIRGTRKKAREFNTDDVLEKLEKLGYTNLVCVKPNFVYNGQTPSRTRGTWVFVNMDYEPEVNNVDIDIVINDGVKTKRKKRKKNTS